MQDLNIYAVAEYTNHGEMVHIVQAKSTEDALRIAKLHGSWAEQKSAVTLIDFTSEVYVYGGE